MRQIPVIHELVRALGWPLVMIDGIEADDVIGTLASRRAARSMRTVISTGDKDLAQLVDDHVMLINTMTSRDGGPLERLDRDGVMAKFGVPPERIVDYLSLVGDTVDNVPGVDKVGPKTAVKWLEQYGSLDGVIVEHADAIGGVVGENLRRALDWLPMARRLVTVKTDCDLRPQVESIDASLDLRREDPAALRALFERCEFRSWLRELDGAGRGRFGRRAGCRVGRRVARAPRRAGGAASRRAGRAGLRDRARRRGARALDRAHRGGRAGRVRHRDHVARSDGAPRLVGLSLSVEPGRACYVPVAHALRRRARQLSREHVLARLRGWLESPRAPRSART